MAYNPKKAAQSIAYLAMQNGGEPLYVLMAVKLVYLADRESVRLRGHPIQSEPRVSMPHGPVNSVTLDFLNGSYNLNETGWADYLSDRANYQVGLRSNTTTLDDLDELSDREMDILSSVWKKFGNMDRFDLCKWTHDQKNVPEWEDPMGSSKTITMASLMAGVGLPNPIERARELEDHEYSASVLASL